LVGELAAVFETVDPLTVCDISCDGILVESSVSPPVESIRSLRFVSGTRVGQVTARVRHVTPIDGGDGRGPYRIGFEFLDLQPAIREEISRLTAADFPDSSES
jgi:hypothetical protein